MHDVLGRDSRNSRGLDRDGGDVAGGRNVRQGAMRDGGGVDVASA